MYSGTSRRILAGFIVFAIFMLNAITATAENVRYVYDDLNRLKRTYKEDGSVVHYIYEAAGNRTQKTFYGGLPAISAMPLSVDFGSIGTGRVSFSRTITVSNSGTSDLAIGTISLTGINAADFGRLNDTCSGQAVAPNNTCTVQVLFSPQTEGAKNATLSIPSNDIDASSVNVSLTGTATPTITVTSPNGGENWAIGGVYPITWTYTGNPGTYVKIELFKAGVFSSTIAATVAKGTNGAGTYNWTIPTTVVPGSDYTVKITSTTTASHTDTSSAVFSIQ